MKRPRGPLGGTDPFGSRLNRETAKINRAVYELGDCSIQEVINYARREFGMELLETRVYKHFMWLVGSDRRLTKDGRDQFKRAGFSTPFAVKTEKGVRLTEEARQRYKQWLEG